MTRRYAQALADRNPGERHFHAAAKPAQVAHVLAIASNTQSISGRDWVATADDPGVLDTARAFTDATTRMLNATRCWLGRVLRCGKHMSTPHAALPARR